MKDDRSARPLESAIATLSFLAIAAGWAAAGGRFLIFPDLWQLLPIPAFADGVGGALLDLHAQPPLLNLLFGSALRTASATGTAPQSWLLAVQLAAGATAVWAIADCASRVARSPVTRVAVVAMILANPYLYASTYFFFYNVWELLFLSLVAAASARFLERPSAPRAALVLAPAVALVYTRSLFHPLWLVLLAGALVMQARRARPGAWRATAAAALVASSLAAAWPAKNLVRFGFAGYSSWWGYNLSRGLPVDRPPVITVFDRADSTIPPPRLAAEAEAALPPSFRGRPALDALAKPDGSPNWNHPAIINASRTLGESARSLLVRSPWLLALRAADSYLNGYTVYEGRQVYTAGWAPEVGAFPRWARVYEVAAMLAFRPYTSAATRLTTGFALLLPLLLGGVAISLAKRRGAWEARDRLVVVLLFCALWVLALVLFVDGAEGNRMRFSTHPFLLIMAAWLVDRPVGVWVTGLKPVFRSGRRSDRSKEGPA